MLRKEYCVFRKGQNDRERVCVSGKTKTQTIIRGDMLHLEFFPPKKDILSGETYRLCRSLFESN